MTRPITLVTGTSAGLGAEFARQCAARGDELVLVARRRDRLEALAAETGRAHVIVADLSAPDAPRRLLGEVERLGLSVSRLINNAGFGLAGRFAALPLARQRAMIDLNVASLTELTHLALPAMLARREGGILNIASTAAFQAGPGMAVYFASKAFVLSFTEALHQECRGTGIKVTALCPGPTATEFGEVAGVTSGDFSRYSLDARRVVSAGLNGLERNQAVVIPGLMNKATAYATRLLPRALLRRIVAGLKI
ncbi:SDR family oxidoreductase [Sphingosinicella sp. BN140058]|uniref:SDR family NAD(P)-dependent oxidoreductase n=1 Tax=Sphingosinicella sp. BN140058 TaxID=1892855 RepID=UPI001011960A|nr:SDR family oxidoreductase [Sphingosinicella sp. BN140058]QAY77021.1 SDR family oxidoreductase [Sphingosinicella sp. BN140058]